MTDETFTKDEFLTWVPASDAVAELRNSMFDTAATEIVRRASVGLLVARVENGFVTKRGQTIPLKQYAAMGQTLWQKVLKIGYVNNNNLWVTNGLQVTLDTYPETEKRYQLFGIRFDPAGLSEMVPERVFPRSTPAPSATSAPSPTPQKHAGGAPPKDIWERVWVEIAAKLYAGDLQPQKLADLEEAIMEIALTLGEEVSEATARRHAKPLWDKIK